MLGSTPCLCRTTTEHTSSREEANDRTQRMYVKCLEHVDPKAAVHDPASCPLASCIFCLFIWTTWVSFSKVMTLLPQRTQLLQNFSRASHKEPPLTLHLIPTVTTVVALHCPLVTSAVAIAVVNNIAHVPREFGAPMILKSVLAKWLLEPLDNFFQRQ